MTRVWLSALRRGGAHHTIDGRHTTCGRFVGEIEDLSLGYQLLDADRGFVMDLATATEVHATRPCARCYGTAQIVTPTVTRRDRRTS